MHQSSRTLAEGQQQLTSPPQKSIDLNKQKRKSLERCDNYRIVWSRWSGSVGAFILPQVFFQYIILYDVRPKYKLLKCTTSCKSSTSSLSPQTAFTSTHPMMCDYQDTGLTGAGGKPFSVYQGEWTQGFDGRVMCMKRSSTMLQPQMGTCKPLPTRCTCTHH